MDLVKVYLIQSITSASNNLRLNAQQIEVVGLLREIISKSEDLGEEFLRMKKTTEFSKLAIRLNEVYTFLSQGKVDFVKISEQFKEHSRYLIRDLNNFLENVNPEIFRNGMIRLNGTDSKAIEVNLVEKSPSNHHWMERESDKNERIIIDEDTNESRSIHKFELQILEPIKQIDLMLNKMLVGKVVYEELKMYSEIMEDHAALSAEKGFTILADMHKIITEAFKGIIAGNLLINKSVIESIRACLIVIAAVVKGKEINITDYINRAEKFGKRISDQKIHMEK